MTCKEVIRRISDYLDSDLDAELQQRLEEHFAGCPHCTAILDGARNVIRLVGDDRVFELPAQFGERLRERLKAEDIGIA